MGTTRITLNIGDSQLAGRINRVKVVGTAAVGPSGVVSVTAPITNSGTSTSAQLALSTGTGLTTSGGTLAANFGTTSTTVAAGDRGLPSGGTAGQVLTKSSSTDYDDSWAEIPRLPYPTVGQEASGSKPASLSLPQVLITGNSSNRSFGANKLYYWPFFVDKQISVTKWFLRVVSNTVGASSTVRAGIYQLSDLLEPGNLVSEFSSLTVATGATGENYTTLSSPLTVTPGRYAIAWTVSSASLTIRIADAIAGFYVPGAGNTAPARFETANNSAPANNPLPNPGPAITSISVDAAAWGFPILLVWSYS